MVGKDKQVIKFLMLRARSAARVTLGMINSDKLAVPINKAKKTPQPKLTYYTTPGPDHPWRRSLRFHIDRG
ncbi:MAG: hypothetical protein DRI01_04155 [Chloroflexi bacterium]|nr:MAG: hypothetical protein DRI01_04155 [Chloroflexota bacterium]